MADLYDHDMERVVLSVIAETSLLNVNDARLLVESAAASPEMFHHPVHRRLFTLAYELLYRHGLPVDPLTVKSHLEGDESLADFGGWSALVETLWGANALGLAGSGAFTSHCKTLRDLALRRVLIQELRQAAQHAADTGRDPAEVLANLTGTLAGMGTSVGRFRSLREILDDIGHELAAVQEEGSQPILPTGIRELDLTIGGWQPTLTVVGAKPGVGKSALFATTVQHAAKRLGVRVGVFSLEDEGSWLGWRILAQEAGVSQFKMRFKKMEQAQRALTRNGFVKLHGYSDNVLVADGSESGMGVDEIVQRANDMIVNHGVRAIFVDHLGEIIGKRRDDRYDLEVSEQLSRLRGVANRHRVPMVVAAHLKRREGLDNGGAPTLTDFANSAGAERKARVAIGLARAPDSDVLEFHVLKNTMGKSGFVVKEQFIGAAAMVRAVEGPQE